MQGRSVTCPRTTSYEEGSLEFIRDCFYLARDQGRLSLVNIKSICGGLNIFTHSEPQPPYTALHTGIKFLTLASSCCRAFLTASIYHPPLGHGGIGECEVT